MYEVKFGYGWKYSATCQDRASAVRLAEALAFKGWRVHVTDPGGVIVSWKRPI